jgi:hypothetical protein
MAMTTIEQDFTLAELAQAAYGAYQCDVNANTSLITSKPVNMAST